MEKTRQIRRGLFETNSSSTHSMSMCLTEEYNKWKNDQDMYFFDKEYCGIYQINEKYDNKIFFTVDEIITFISDHDKHFQKYKNKDYNSLTNDDDFDKDSDVFFNLCNMCGFKTYESYSYNDELEFFSENFITPNNESITAFGLFGYE